MKPKQTRIGLALGSGGPRGLAHIGVIKALLDHDIPIDVIAGSSAGALIGGMYLALGSIEAVENIATSLTYKDILAAFVDFGSFSGIIKGIKLEDRLEKILHNQTIERLPIPFAAVATDILSGDAITITKGSLTKAIRASSSIPALIDAAHIGNSYLIDGGGSNPIPVSVARSLGGTRIIAVNLDAYKFTNEDDKHVFQRPSMANMGIAALNMLRHNLAKKLCEDADVTITPAVSSISSINLAQFLHGETIIQKGYDATLAVMPKIKRLIDKSFES